MNVVRCINKHFFDGDEYGLCPHCGAEKEEGAEETTTSPLEKGEKGLFGSFFGKKEQSETNEVKEETSNTSDSRETKEDDTSTVGLIKISGSIETEILPIDTTSPSEDDIKTEAYYDEQQNENDVSKAEEKESLATIIQTASANIEGKTMGYFSAVTKSTSAHKEEASAPIEPIVGWLVCIKGVHFGEALNIYAGINSIGRNADNRIVLGKDNSISREKHAFITYEPKKRGFYIKPGDSTGLTYVNEDFITETKKLVSKDIIELGNSKFLFVPLCDENFSWEEYLGKE